MSIIHFGFRAQGDKIGLGVAINKLHQIQKCVDNMSAMNTFVKYHIKSTIHCHKKKKHINCRSTNNTFMKFNENRMTYVCHLRTNFVQRIFPQNVYRAQNDPF